MWWMFVTKQRDSYRRYLLQHKWAVKEAGLELGVPRWRLFLHDWDKFTPKMFSAYAESFYDENGISRYQPTKEFWETWKRHQRISPHHYQYYYYKNTTVLDSGEVRWDEDFDGMPLMARLEMLADWKSFEVLGKGTAKDFYIKTRDKKKQFIHPKTIAWLDEQLGVEEDGSKRAEI